MVLNMVKYTLGLIWKFHGFIDGIFGQNILILKILSLKAVFSKCQFVKVILTGSRKIAKDKKIKK